MCQGARRLGYTGLEIAPFTLGDDPAALPAEKRRELRRTMASEGIAYVGLHAILTAPKGLHVTTPDTGGSAAELGICPQIGRSRRRPW